MDTRPESSADGVAVDGFDITLLDDLLNRYT